MAAQKVVTNAHVVAGRATHPRRGRRTAAEPPRPGDRLQPHRRRRRPASPASGPLAEPCRRPAGYRAGAILGYPPKRPLEARPSRISQTERVTPGRLRHGPVARQLTPCAGSCAPATRRPRVDSAATSSPPCSLAPPAAPAATASPTHHRPRPRRRRSPRRHGSVRYGVSDPPSGGAGRPRPRRLRLPNAPRGRSHTASTR